MSVPLLNNPRILADYIENNQRIVAPFFEELFQEGVADGSIKDVKVPEGALQYIYHGHRYLVCSVHIFLLKG